MLEYDCLTMKKTGVVLAQVMLGIDISLGIVLNAWAAWQAIHNSYLLIMSSSNMHANLSVVLKNFQKRMEHAGARYLSFNALQQATLQSITTPATAPASTFTNNEITLSHFKWRCAIYKLPAKISGIKQALNKIRIFLILNQLMIY
jgi:hypothetical protein